MTPSSSYDNLQQLVQQPYSHVELKPINLEFEHNGKTYEITFVKQKIGGEKGEEKKLDLTNLKPEDIQALVKQAKKAMEMMGQLDGADVFKNSKSFTFHFTTQIKEPTFLNNILGKKIKRFEYKPNPSVFDSITYKEGLEDKKFTVNLSKYEKGDQERIQRKLQPLNTTIEKLFEESAKAAKPLKLGEHKAETPIVEKASDQSDSVDQAEPESDPDKTESEEEDLELASLREELLSIKPNKNSSSTVPPSEAHSSADPDVADLQARLAKLRE
ncbi:MAG: hypothetical protein KBA81_04615 [Rhabdochlamydiaceae bacterium]|nr:hypothetical protein [Rhabdochlamydiaceae bacterium]